jgi:hypothetical protein
MSEERFDRIEDELRHVRSQLTDLDHHMRILHEDTLARVSGLFEERLATKAELDRGLARTSEAADRRLGPLEATVRQHSVDID